MQIMHIFEGNGWFIETIDVAANRSFTGPGRIGPVPESETQKHLEWYAKQGAKIQDRREVRA